MKVCIVGASGKLGTYMVQHALDRGYKGVGVCREQSVGKLDGFEGLITEFPGATNDRAVIEKAVVGCDGVLTVLVPWGVHGHSSGTAQDPWIAEALATLHDTVTYEVPGLVEAT